MFYYTTTKLKDLQNSTRKSRMHTTMVVNIQFPNREREREMRISYCSLLFCAEKIKENRLYFNLEEGHHFPSNHNKFNSSGVSAY